MSSESDNPRHFKKSASTHRKGKRGNFVNVDLAQVRSRLHVAGAMKLVVAATLGLGATFKFGLEGAKRHHWSKGFRFAKLSMHRLCRRGWHCDGSCGGTLCGLPR